MEPTMNTIAYLKYNIVRSNTLRLCNLIGLLLISCINYLFAQDVTSYNEESPSDRLNLNARNGLFSPDENNWQIIRDNTLQMMGEQVNQNNSEYYVNRPRTGYTGVSEQDSLALVALYNSTGNDTWTKKDNWLTGEPLYTWYGIVLNVDDTRVDRVLLNNNNLNGTIPAEIGNLTALRTLSLNNNQLSGPIPTELGNLSGLQELYLHWNTLNGSIPSELGQLQNLTSFWLYNNTLDGEIPPEIGDLTNLRYLWLDNNKLTGNIPSELGGLTNLIGLTLYKNELSGSIPGSLGNLTNLEYLYAYENQLSGDIPPELGNLLKLEYLSLSNNELTGTIPAELGALNELYELYLYNNKLDGSIPTALGNLHNLTDIYLHNNNLTGSIPASLGTLTNLVYLELDTNNLSGPLPVSLGELDNLRGLWLYDNQLDGNIPSELGNLKNLKDLSLYSNKLTGSIPPELGDLTNLEGLFLDFNILTGPIPVELTKLSNLKWLDFSSNEINGPIPPELGLLTHLEELHLYENALTDTIPHELGDLSNLKMLSLGRNKLKDPNSLPDLQVALLRLTELNWFLADGNEFTKFPELKSLAKLNTLEIQKNRLHFDSIEPNIGIITFRYAPQDSIGPVREKSLDTGTNFTVDLRTVPGNIPITVGGSNNQYQWFQGKTAIPGATSDSYTIIQADHIHTGHYVLRITNTLATECALYSRPITVMVTETVSLSPGTGTEVDCFTLGLKIIADVEYPGNVRVLFFNSEPKPGTPPEGILQIAGLYFTFDADPSLRFSNAKLKIPINELTDRGIDPSEIKWLRRPESGTGEWIDLQGTIEGNYFVSIIPFDSFSEFTFGLTEITNVNHNHGLPEQYQLYQNYPNPFNPITTIRYSLPERAHVILTVYNTLGQSVERIFDAEAEAGIHEISFDASSLSSGLYFYRLQAGEYVDTKRFVFLK
jgi:Leucine-rich repeat (LRR) protein